MNNQQQTGKAEKVASKLINKLALTELELANREVDIDELNARIQQLTQVNQQLKSQQNKPAEEKEAA
ncbi:hypothetical protein [Limosilactobacillus reuteri]|uniref:hypothetical protein n=1 Tax=Limosilactobacillus reuteri TaxID=1598 RepID=UPI001E581DA1|nr:hypothetical protein [Limosilactobacillus reuteri]MCC4359217.1 hypothetical protein [Limosilactobacillus reuteri]MCC4361644.1 hypothetical protein [Limosilactobacillus reuteri]MCC4365519.1 hypothetical protein [Limosilactobacillus reuteri]MCC4508645.1 hypothetical protein [Limosilactobacillus reuteri]